MPQKIDLRSEVNSLDLMIAAISSELIEEPQCWCQSSLVKEMEEALCELKQARGLRKVWLSILEPGPVVAEERAECRPRRMNAA